MSDLKTRRGTHILRIQCPDEKGLVHKVTGVLYKEGFNIVRNDEFVDPEARRFFMRTEFSGSADSPEILKKLRALLPRSSAVELAPHRKKNIVVLVTKEPHCIGDLLIRHAYGELYANLLAVVSNHNMLKPLAEKFGIPYYFIPHEGKTRRAHEAALLKIIGEPKPEIIVLAKYMRILSGDFVRRYENRLINIHHSFLPAFAGAYPYKQAQDRGVKIIGATAHFVNEHLDKGPIIAQGVVPVDHSHGVQDMAQAGRDVEKIVLAKALHLAFEDRIFVSGNKTIVFE